MYSALLKKITIVVILLLQTYLHGSINETKTKLKKETHPENIYYEYGLVKYQLSAWNSSSASGTWLSGFSFTGGKKINKEFGIGAGIAVNSLGIFMFSPGNFIPFYADFLFEEEGNKSDSYIFVDTGYSFTTNSDLSGGLFLNGGIGFKIKSELNFLYDVSLSYLYQHCQSVDRSETIVINNRGMHISQNEKTKSHDLGYISLGVGFYLKKDRKK